MKEGWMENISRDSNRIKYNVEYTDHPLILDGLLIANDFYYRRKLIGFSFKKHDRGALTGT